MATMLALTSAYPEFMKAFEDAPRTIMTKVVIRQLAIDDFNVNHPLLDLMHHLGYPATLEWNKDQVFTSGLKALREIILANRKSCLTSADSFVWAPEDMVTKRALQVDDELLPFNSNCEKFNHRIRNSRRRWINTILGEVDLSGLVAQQKPNLEGCVDVFQAAESYEIKGLAQAAMAAFQERSVKFSEHAELKRLIESGLPSD